MTRCILITALVMATYGAMNGAGSRVPESLNPAEADGIWLRPSKKLPAEPIIGFRDGIRIGLWPATSWPRGTIRIFAPSVFPGDPYPVLNLMAIEPIVNGVRGYSELERSRVDERRGLRMWFSDKADASEGLPWNTPRGRKGRIWVDGKPVETLSIYLHVEEFGNGAHPYVLVTFRADRPDEVGFKVFAHADSAPMEACVLTATMGNYSRCRLLWLKDEVLDSRKVWPGYRGGDFVWTDEIPAGRMFRAKDGTLTVAITPNETELAGVAMPEGGWHFGGKVSTQYWRKYPGTTANNLRVRVNGRAMYYGTNALIPGGVAYENFELIEDFRPGIESSFGVTLLTPRKMGWK